MQSRSQSAMSFPDVLNEQLRIAPKELVDVFLALGLVDGRLQS